MTGRHATGSWIRVTTAAAFVQARDLVLGLPYALVDIVRETFTPQRPAAAPATAIAGTFPRAAGPIDAPHRRGVVDRAAAGLNPAAAPIDRIALARALDEFRAEVAAEGLAHGLTTRTARSHINAGS